MEIVLAIAIGVLFGSGVWLVLRPRSFQVVIGLMLLSYAVNLFIFGMGRLNVDKPPLTLTPPLTVTQAEMARALDIIEECIAEVGE